MYHGRERRKRKYERDIWKQGNKGAGIKQVLKDGNDTNAVQKVECYAREGKGSKYKRKRAKRSDKSV